VAEFRRIYRDAGSRPRRSFHPPHVLIKRLLPYGPWRALQKRFGYAMGMGQAGASEARTTGR
jgi:hypothetical protein